MDPLFIAESLFSNIDDRSSKFPEVTFHDNIAFYYFFLCKLSLDIV